MDKFMEIAIEQAIKSKNENGIPIGSVLSKDGVLLSKGHNKRIQENSQILHAEIDCLNNAGRINNSKGLVLYSTLMPCYMCAGAIVQFGIKKVVVGENKNFKGAYKFLIEHGVEVINMNSRECIKMLSDYINSYSEIWYEDIGC